jgi:hypothetical protein
MTAPDPLTEQFDEWRGYVRQRRALTPADAAELEDHLRGSVDELTGLGLRPDEAFLVAVKRMGSLDEVSREFAREHSERLWKQLVLPGDSTDPTTKRSRADLWAMLICAVGAAVTVKVPSFLGTTLEAHPSFFARNAALFALPWLAAFLLWRRRAQPWVIAAVVALFALGGVAANVYPYLNADNEPPHTLVLGALHLPLALWLVIALAYVAGDLRNSRRLMDFIRFTGEWFVYFVLIGLGGVVLMGVTSLTFNAVGHNPSNFIVQWLLPCGGVGAVVVAGWLVESKQGVIENIAPVLSRLFTPLFTAVLVAFLVVTAVNHHGLNVNRDELILFDLLLVVVLGLMLYTLSARDPLAPPSLFDALSLGLIVSALIVDALVLGAISGRMADDYGATPNRVSALGENAILLVNLAGAAWLLLAFLRRRKPFAAQERWQTAYLAVYAGWAWLVVLAFPPLFHYV